jgi:hypothetical protein
MIPFGRSGGDKKGEDQSQGRHNPNEIYLDISEEGETMKRRSRSPHFSDVIVLRVADALSVTALILMGLSSAAAPFNPLMQMWSSSRKRE